MKPAKLAPLLARIPPSKRVPMQGVKHGAIRIRITARIIAWLRRP